MDDFITPSFLTSCQDNFAPTVKSHIHHFTPRWVVLSPNMTLTRPSRNKLRELPTYGHGARAINTRTNQGNNAPNEGSSAGIQSLSKKVEDGTAERGQLRENIAALSTKIDQNIAEISHWKAEVEALSPSFRMSSAQRSIL